MPVKYREGLYVHEDGRYTFQSYEESAEKTASYKNVEYLPLGLTEEVGELVHEFAKTQRTNSKLNSPAVLNEVGDVLWVLSQIARECGFTLEEAAKKNLEKLLTRSENGSIHDKVYR